MNLEQFYPTPAGLAKNLVGMLKNREYYSMALEPSAGTGDLAKIYCSEIGCSKKSVHCVEINAERAAILCDKNYAVVWDDFMTFNPLMPYGTIIMNPPFHSGAKHLLKALNILAEGGEVVCILNAETIKNPFSRERKALMKRLKQMEMFKVSFVQSAFEDTAVEVAIIYARKAKSKIVCPTLDKFKSWVVDEDSLQTNLFPAPSDPVDFMIGNYRAEVQAALSLYKEIQNYNAITLQNTNNKYDYDAVFDIKINEVGNTGNALANIVKRISYNYWRNLLYSKDLAHLLTSEVQSSYVSKLYEMADFEFNERNILQLKSDLCATLLENIDHAIMKVFEEFTFRYAYTDYSQNIHYYNGWKTNKAYKVNSKVIIPLYAFDSWDGKFRPSYTVNGILSDIEKVMSYLDCGRMGNGYSMSDILDFAEKIGQSRNIDSKFFTVTLYKKGTCHLTFKSPELLKKFNLYCGRKKGWLPDGYGRKTYSDLSDEEKTVADSFEGRESYEETYKNQQFYFPSSHSSIKMLGAGNI